MSKEREPRLKWGGSLEAQSQADEACERVKRSVKPKVKKSKKKKKNHHLTNKNWCDTV